MQKKARATACTVGQFKELQVGNTNKLFIKVQSKPGQIGLVQFSGWIDFRIELGGPSGSKIGLVQIIFKIGPQMIHTPDSTQSYTGTELNPNVPLSWIDFYALTK